jgi:DNA-directed RNA polymerase subunit F
VEGGEMKKGRRPHTEARRAQRSFKMNELLNRLNNTLKTQLKRQNDIMQQMLDIMPKPEGKLRKIMETAVLFIGTFGIINLIDVIIKWVIGG